MWKPDIRQRKLMHRSAPALIPTLAACLISFICVTILPGCAGKKQPAKPSVSAPAVTLAETPGFFLAHLQPANQDLGSFSEMEASVAKSLRYAKSRPQNDLAINTPLFKATWGDLSKTLSQLYDLLPELDKNPGLLEENFDWIAIPAGIDYSGYYEPRVKASRTRKPGFEHPIYKLPPDLASVKKKRGRYYDRRTIEESQILANQDLELAWAADPVDVFFLEIQGSGKLIFDDGTEAYVNYAGQNGHKYKSSGRIMREKGLLKRGDIFEQREWLAANPDRVTEILHENPSFVFFKFGSRGPTGAMGATVDDWISLAVDRSQIPLGAVVAYGVNLPDEKMKVFPARGIGLAHDVGGAIKNSRIDIFCGGDDRANFVASHLDAKGPAWILLAK